MDITLLIALASLVLLLIFAVGFFLSTKKQATEVKEQPERDRAGVVPPRRAQLARNRGIRLRAAQQQHNQNVGTDPEPETERNIEFPDGKIGAKKKAKLEAKAEKKAQREVEEQLRTDKKLKEKQLEEEKKKVEEKEKAENKKREEEEIRLREEKEKREYEEYLKMKEAFSVEEEGFEEGEENEKNILQEFVDYIKKNKVVIIEDLAAQFKLKTQAALDRIKDLQNDNILTGVIDDRGKFIYVSQEEMEGIVKFIRQRGRVSILELVENSNNLVTMTPVITTQ